VGQRGLSLADKLHLSGSSRLSLLLTLNLKIVKLLGSLVCRSRRGSRVHECFNLILLVLKGLNLASLLGVGFGLFEGRGLLFGSDLLVLSEDLSLLGVARLREVSRLRSRNRGRLGEGVKVWLKLVLELSVACGTSPLVGRGRLDRRWDIVNHVRRGGGGLHVGGLRLGRGAANHGGEVRVGIRGEVIRVGGLGLAEDRGLNVLIGLHHGHLLLGHHVRGDHGGGKGCGND